MSKDILVSISCITYNQVDYIKECLDSFLMQKTNFLFEVLLHDDASTDGTIEILQKYEKLYPSVFRVMIQKENQYCKGIRGINARYNFPRALGKYIALCDGDDYWTDPLKLQKQVDFLEENEQYSLVCTNYNSSVNKVKDINNGKEITLQDILLSNPIGTLTVMIRKDILLLVKPSILEKSFSMGDYPLWLWIARQSKIYKLGDVTAYYRILENSVSGRDDYKKKMKFDLDALEITKYFLPDSGLSISEKREILRERYGHLFNILIKKSDRSFLKYQWYYFKDIKYFNLIDFKILIKGLKVYF